MVGPGRSVLVRRSDERSQERAENRTRDGCRSDVSANRDRAGPFDQPVH